MPSLAQGWVSGLMTSEAPTTYCRRGREALREWRAWLGDLPRDSSVLPAALQLGRLGCFLQCDDSVMEGRRLTTVQSCRAPGMLVCLSSSPENPPSPVGPRDGGEWRALFLM